jgi:aspartyl-tRNA(Asn)/glutamyl-tRNA(Gln) amidotransferase subunit B
MLACKKKAAGYTKAIVALSQSKDYKLNPKIEIKNINSFRALEKAIDYEIKRQIAAIEDGEKLMQETRGWNENAGETVRQRSKETSADYRYFPEPDLPPINIDDEWLRDIRCQLTELPTQKKERFMHEYELDAKDAEVLVSDKELAKYAENVISELRAWIDANGDDWERQKKKLSKAATNWLLSELLKHLKADGAKLNQIKITPENFAELVCLVYQGKINSSAGQTILEKMYAHGGDPTHIMTDMGLEQVDDTAELEKVVADIIEKNQAQVEQYRAGKEAVLQFFVGQSMAATKGKANPKILAEILKKLLSK